METKLVIYNKKRGKLERTFAQNITGYTGELSRYGKIVGVTFHGR